MTSQSVQVRARWLDGRIETLDSLEPGAEKQTLEGLGRDLRWYRFRHSGEIDGDGFLIFVQDPEPVLPAAISPAEVIVLSAPCSQCGKGVEIHCKAPRGLGEMTISTVPCPHCLNMIELPLPDGGEFEVVKADSDDRT